MSVEERYVTEVPSSLKQLARLVVRGFNTVEDTLIIDMLVRNPCKYNFHFISLFFVMILLDKVVLYLKTNLTITLLHYFILIVSKIIKNLYSISGMKEDDICDLLKFEKKQLRARITTLKSDKIIQTRLRMETGTDGKAQKVNYYFINYKVNFYSTLFICTIKNLINLKISNQPKFPFCRL